MRAFRDTVLAFDRACRSAGVPHAFVGGVAVMAWGIPRATADVDAIVVLAAEDAERLALALAKEGLAVAAADLLDAVTDRAHVSVFDDASGFHVDVKLAETPDEVREITEAVEVDVDGGRVRVPRPEEVIAFKVRFGSPQDVADARGIIHRQRDRLDVARLRVWAARLGVAADVERLLSE